jgi:predicted transposase YdaD
MGTRSSPDLKHQPLCALAVGRIDGAGDAGTVAIAEQIAQAPLSRHEQSELTGLLVVLAGARTDRNLILHLLRRHDVIEDIIKESSFYEVVLEEGIEQGIEKGIEKGQLKAMRQLAQDALSARFGALDEALVQRIGQLTDTELLRHLILDVVQFPDLPAVMALVDSSMSAEE